MAALSLSSGDVADDLSRYIHAAAGDERRFEIAIKGARCAGCIAKIEGGVKAIAGVSDARLNLSTGKLSVAWHGDTVQPQGILRRVRDLGYAAQPFEAPALLDADAREGRVLLRCLAVAGFGTVFIMGLTDAVWYGADLSPALREGFFWLAAVVSVPVTFYAGQPFFRSAWSVLRHWRTNMDVPISLALVLALGRSRYQPAQHAQDT